MPNVTPPRTPPSQTVGYIRGTVTFSDDGTVVEIGKLPNGALIIKAMSGAQSTEAYDDTGVATIDVGYAAYVDSDEADVVADPNAFATLLDMKAVGYDVLDEATASFIAVTNRLGVGITASLVLGTGDAVTGSTQIVVCYTMPDA